MTSALPQLHTDTTDLANEITRLAGHINAANFRFLRLIAEFDRVRHHFGLDDTHLLIHSMTGGLIDPDEPSPWDGDDADDDEEGVI